MPLGYSCSCQVTYRRTTSGSYSSLPPCESLGLNSDHGAEPSGQTQGPLSVTWVEAPKGNAAPQAAGSSVGLTTYLTFVPSDLCPTKSSLFCFWNVANPMTSIYKFHYISLHYHHGLYHITWSRRLPGLYSKSILAPLRCVFLTEPLPVSVNGTPFGDRG